MLPILGMVLQFFCKDKKFLNLTGFQNLSGLKSKTLAYICRLNEQEFGR